MRRKKMKTHKLAKAKLLKPIQGHRPGQIITRRAEHIDNLIKLGIAEAIEPEVKEEKTPIETKEEKFAPKETKAEPKDFTSISIPKLREMAASLSDDDLLDIVKADFRKGAVALAQEELQKRG
jgi:hypothetical protein